MEARRRPLVGAIGPAVGGGAAASPSLMQALFGRVPLTACVRTGFFVVGALGFIRLMWALLFIRHSSGAHWPHCRRYPLTQPTVLSAAFPPLRHLASRTQNLCDSWRGF